MWEYIILTVVNSLYFSLLANFLAALLDLEFIDEILMSTLLLDKYGSWSATTILVYTDGKKWQSCMSFHIT